MRKPKGREQLYTAGEAGKILACGKDNIRRMVTEGRLRCRREGDHGHFKIPESSIIEYQRSLHTVIPKETPR